MLNVMTEVEAAQAGVEFRRSYFKVTDDKTSMSAPPDSAEWYQIRSVDLGNGDDKNLGDQVGVVTRWQWPNAFDGVTVSDLRKVQAALRDGRWRASPQAKDWAGHAVADVLNLDMNRAKISTLLKAWTKKGALVVVEGLDDKREKRPFIEVGEPAND